MNKFLISISFLLLLYIVKILLDFKRFNDDPDCYNLHEKLRDSKSAYLVAIPLSYIYCLIGAYDEWIEKIFCAELIHSYLLCLGLVIPAILISIQNKENNGTANNFSDMSGAVFFISAVTEATIYFMIYALVFVIMLLIYIVKYEKEDNDMLHKIMAIGVETVLLLFSVFSDKLVSVLFSFRFVDNMLYYSILMLLSELIIPPISNRITSLLYNRYKLEE